MVNIILTSENNPVHAYKDKKDFGYIQLQSVEMVINGNWIGEKKRTTLMRGSVELLQKYVATLAKNNMLAGKISVSEFLEDNCPENYLSRLNDKIPYEESILQFLKSVDKDGPLMTSGGKRILRFTDYDPSGTAVDILVQHDNVDEIKAYNAAKKTAGANLPG